MEVRCTVYRTASFFTDLCRVGLPLGSVGLPILHEISQYDDGGDNNQQTNEYAEIVSFEHFGRLIAVAGPEIPLAEKSNETS